MPDDTKIDYKRTLNLPETPFPMRGDLAKRADVLREREQRFLCRVLGVLGRDAKAHRVPNDLRSVLDHQRFERRAISCARSRLRSPIGEMAPPLIALSSASTSTRAPAT